MHANPARSSARAGTFVVLVITVGFAILGSSAPAGARVAATNDRFCSVLGGDQGASIDFEGLGPSEAHLAARVIRKAAKTGVPASLATDLTKIASIYDRIADGEPAAKVLDARRQQALVPRLTRFGKYFAANCIATPTP